MRGTSPGEGNGGREQRMNQSCGSGRRTREDQGEKKMVCPQGQKPGKGDKETPCGKKKKFFSKKKGNRRRRSRSKGRHLT